MAKVFLWHKRAAWDCYIAAGIGTSVPLHLAWNCTLQWGRPYYDMHIWEQIALLNFRHYG